MMMTEIQLREQLKNNDENALFSIMALFYNDLFRYGTRFTADTEVTKDLVNDFFLHVWDNRSRFALAVKLKAYLIVSFKRFLIARLREKNHIDLPRHLSGELYEYSYEDFVVAAQADEERKFCLRQAIGSLPARQKELVRLRFYEQLSYEEIAAKTSLSLRTVYNKLHEAIKKLRRHMLLKKLV